MYTCTCTTMATNEWFCMPFFESRCTCTCTPYIKLESFSLTLGPQKKSLVSCHRLASKSVQWRTCLYTLRSSNLSRHLWLSKSLYQTLFESNSQMDYFPYTQVWLAKRGFTNWANVHTPMWKSRLKHSVAEFQSIQEFWLQLSWRG